MAKAQYILKTVGITLPGYERKDLKVGKSVTLDSKIGDGYAERGFLVKAEETITKEDNGLKAENAKLKAENAKLKAAQK